MILSTSLREIVTRVRHAFWKHSCSNSNQYPILSFAAKVDNYVEQVTRKTANYLSEVLEDQREKLLENLTANGMDLATFLTRFQWDMAKYPIKQSLRNLTDIISEYRKDATSETSWFYTVDMGKRNPLLYILCICKKTR